MYHFRIYAIRLRLLPLRSKQIVKHFQETDTIRNDFYRYIRTLLFLVVSLTRSKRFLTKFDKNMTGMLNIHIGKTVYTVIDNVEAN